MGDPDIRLCQHCRELELTLNDFLLQEPMPLMAWPNRYRGQYGIGRLSEITRKATNCPVCHLIVVSLGIDIKEFQLLEEHFKGSQCIVLWSTNDRLAGAGPHGGVYVTRALTIRCDPMHSSWYANAKLELHENTFPKDDERLFLGRDVPASVHPCLLQSWLSRCCNSHSTCSMPAEVASGPSDYPVAPQSRLDMLRLIDCEQLCIVEKALSEAQYLTLSYVWGIGPRLKLVESNSTRLRIKGSLKALEQEIPSTIRDAMTLTKVLQYRYIWVDSLCILQDSDIDKAVFIPRMNEIYHRAELTIVVAEGNAYTGLRGSSGKTRTSREARKDVGDGLVLHAPRNIRDSLNSSAYATRAWTFQEQYLSRRCLFFLPDQVFFQCRSSTYREDKYLEDDRVFGWPMADRSPIDLYVSCVKNFAPRSLTYSSDVLKACAGMMNAIAGMNWRTYPRFPPAICSIPTGWFEYGLIWHMDSRTPSTTRRSSEMPSWSWCTLQGPANIFERMKTLEDLNEFMAHTWIRWVLHQYDNSGPLASTMLDITTDQTSRAQGLFNDNTRFHPVTDNTRIALEDIEASRLCGDPTRLALHFATLVVDVNVIKSFSGWFEGHHIGIEAGSGAIGFCQLDDYSFLLPGASLRCALVCQTTETYGHNHSFGLEDYAGSSGACHVLVIEQKNEHEYVERIGVGFIFMDAIDDRGIGVWREVWLK